MLVRCHDCKLSIMTETTPAEVNEVCCATLATHSTRIRIFCVFLETWALIGTFLHVVEECNRAANFRYVLIMRNICTEASRMLMNLSHIYSQIRFR